MDMIWHPRAESITNARITEFRNMVNVSHDLHLRDSLDLHDFSIRHPIWFWSGVMDYCCVFSERGRYVVEPSSDIWKTRFFPDTHLNYAHNLLRRRDNSDAIIFRGEDRLEERLSWDQLYDRTARLHSYFKQQQGLRKGDRVVAMMPNMPQTIIAMLATASHGAVWSSCSPDFGNSAVLSRFSQIHPRFFVVCDGYFYKGKLIDISDKVVDIISGLPTLEHILVVSYIGRGEDLVARLGEKAILFDSALSGSSPDEIDFVSVAFNDPLYILYSSGTTGAPKCIVHSAGGVLIQHVKEHQLHCNFRPGDRLLYFTTCGWMMWNWMVSALASEVTLLLYDGSPFHPKGPLLFDYLCDERACCFGTSAKFIDAMKNDGLRPIETHDVSSLSTILSTGSPLSPENFDYVYEAIKQDIHLASISGGTDICGCFVIGDPTRPVYRGEIQGSALGLDVQIYDPDGHPVISGNGELVCVNAFPSMPIMFWDDPDGSKYQAAYFEHFPNIWCQGDFVSRTGSGGFIIHGRSDATLNPSGVRIGTSEIYDQVECMPQILESVAIGQKWDGDIRVVLFIILASGYTFDHALEQKICEQIRINLSPRHVPAKIIPISDIPRTISGKISELAVHDAVHGIKVRHSEALSNPESLDLYINLSQLRS